MSLKKDFGYIAHWSQRAFPDQTVEGARNKLFEEVRELVVDDDELVDVFIVAITLAHKLYGLDTFEDMVRHKMQVNDRRTWQALEDGRYRHREDAQS